MTLPHHNSSPRPAHRLRRAFTLSNSLAILASLLALSSHQDAKSIVGIDIIGASAFDVLPPSSKSLSTNTNSNHRRPLFFVDDDENTSSSSTSNGTEDDFFFMNDADDDGAGTPTFASTSPSITGRFTPRPPSIPPPSRFSKKSNMSPPTMTQFERKAVVLSSTISGNDPNGGISNNADIRISTISDAFKQAKQANAKFFGGLKADLPTFGGARDIDANANANANANADIVNNPFLQMVSNAATNAAEAVAPTIEQIEEEAEEEMVVGVPKDTVDGAIFAALATAYAATHSTLFCAMAGSLAVYAVKSPGLGGDVARLVGSATNSVGYVAAVVAQSTVNSALSSLPDPVETSVVRISKAVGGAMNAAKEGIQENDFVKKVVAEAAPTVQSKLQFALEAIGKALASSANANEQYLLAPASAIEDQKERIEVNSLPDPVKLLDAAAAVSANAILQAVTEEEQARANLHHNTGEEIDRRWEVAASETNEVDVDIDVHTSFQRNRLARQFRQPQLVAFSVLEADRRERLVNMRRRMLELSVAEQKHSLDRLAVLAVAPSMDPMPFQRALLSRQLTNSQAVPGEASVASIEAKRSDRLQAMRRQMLEISALEKNHSLSRLEQREKRHQFAKIESFAQQAVDAAAKAASDSRRAFESGITLTDLESASTNELLSNLQLIRHKPSIDDVEPATEVAADNNSSDSMDSKNMGHGSKRARAKKALRRLMR